MRILPCACLTLIALVAGYLAPKAVAQPRLVLLTEHMIGKGSFRAPIYVDSAAANSGAWFSRANWHSKGRFIIETSIPFLNPDVYKGMSSHIQLNGIDPSANEVASWFVKAVGSLGGVTISKATWRLLPNDTLQRFCLTFDEAVNVELIETLLTQMPFCETVFIDDWTSSLSVPRDGSFDPRASTRTLYNTGEDDQFSHHAFNHRTRAWSHYSVKMPMAWDITTGNANVVIGIVDGYNSCDPSPQTSELVEKLHTDSAGNVRRAVSSTTSAYTGLASNTGNGVDKSSYPVKTGHGYSVAGAILATGDFDSTGKDRGSVVGACPDCNGMFFPLNPPGEGFQSDPCKTPAPNAIDGVKDASLSYEIDMLDDFDVDLQEDADGTIKRIDILNCSYIGGGGILHKRLLRNGVVIVAAAGNNWGTAPMDPAATAIIEQDPQNDVKILAVGSISDGELLDSDCRPWTINGKMNPVWKGAERFTTDFLFSPGLEKFPIGNQAQRESARRLAYMDVVAPGGNIWSLQEKRGDSLSSRGYAFQMGTSFSTAIVSGIAGLMLSVNPNMGVAMDEVSDLPAHGYRGPDVQQRLYNIVTFTADKIADQNKAYQYVSQGNDVLKRSWSQRMGFGKVNAYRAVAHSIPHKGEYIYQESTKLEVDDDIVNSIGIRLIHWGSMIMDGVDVPLGSVRGPSAADDGLFNVLDYGGVSLPGELHNNQGVTRLSAPSQIKIVVPDSTALCADGYIIGQGASGPHMVIAEGNASTISIDGILQDIEIKGSVRIADLILEGSKSNSKVTATKKSDVYGNVQLRSGGRFAVTGKRGYLTLRPGSNVALNGEGDLDVVDGAVLVAGHASSVSRSAGQRVSVRDGSTMRVSAGASVTIDALVHVTQGSTFIVEDSAVVFIRDLVVDAGCSFVVHPGAHVIFGDSVINIYGHAKINGGVKPDERVVLTASIRDNCWFDRRDHAMMDSVVTLRVDGSSRHWSESGIAMSFTDLKNVRVDIINAVSEPVLACRFSHDRTRPNQLSLPDAPTMLRARITQWPHDAPESYTFFSVLESTFSDSARTVKFSSYEAPVQRTMQRYPFGGISAIGFERLDVTASTFSFLRSGVVSQANGYTTVNSSAFTEMDMGVHVTQGRPRICSDTFSLVERPVILRHADNGTIVDNEFRRSRVGVFVDDCAMQAFRSNHFQEYWRAIEVRNSAAALTSLRRDLGSEERELFGRNRFDVSNPAMIMQEPIAHPNPYQRRKTQAMFEQDVATMSDLWGLDLGAFFLVRCGYNRFSQFATYHAGYAVPTNRAIDFSFNNMRPLRAARTINVGGNGTPLYVDEQVEPMCGPIAETIACSEFSWSNERSPLPGGSKQPLHMVEIESGIVGSSIRAALTSAVTDTDELYLTDMSGRKFNANSSGLVPGVYALSMIRNNIAVERTTVLLYSR